MEISENVTVQRNAGIEFALREKAVANIVHDLGRPDAR